MTSVDALSTTEFCYLTTRGRRTGQPHRIEIWFVAHDEGAYILSDSDLADWYRNLVADELASRMGAFALARSLRDAAEPYTGVIVVLLERTHDAWLASWSGADAWYVKPADPFAVADRLWELLGERGLVRELEGERA